MKRSRQVKGDIPSYDAMRKFHTEESEGGEGGEGPVVVVSGETGEGGIGGTVSIYEQLKQKWKLQLGRAKQNEEEAGRSLDLDGSKRATQIEKYMTNYDDDEKENDVKAVMDLFYRWQDENPTKDNSLYNKEYKDFTTKQKNTGLYWFIQRQIFLKNLAERQAAADAKKEADKKAADKAAEDKAAADKAAIAEAAAYVFDESWISKPVSEAISMAAQGPTKTKTRPSSKDDWENWYKNFVNDATALQMQAIFLGFDSVGTYAEDFYNLTYEDYTSSSSYYLRVGGAKIVGGRDAHNILMFNIHDKFDRTIQSLQAIQDARTSTDAYGNKRAKNFNEMGDWINAKAQIENLSAINANMKLATFLGMRNRKI